MKKYDGDLFRILQSKLILFERMLFLDGNTKTFFRTYLY